MTGRTSSLLLGQIHAQQAHGDNATEQGVKACGRLLGSRACGWQVLRCHVWL